VELRNVSDADVWVVGVLDGSEAGMRFPHFRFGRFGQRADERDALIDLIGRVPRGVLTAMADVTVS
jgi:hypothetical protein